MAVTRIYVGHTNTRQKLLAVGLLGVMMVFGFVGASVIGPGIYKSRMSELDLSRAAWEAGLTGVCRWFPPWKRLSRGKSLS